jgi:hypothetical protein
MEATEDRKASGGLTEEMFLLCNNRGTKSNRKAIQYSAEVTCTELHRTGSMKLIVTELPVALASTEILGSESQRIRSHVTLSDVSGCLKELFHSYRIRRFSNKLRGAEPLVEKLTVAQLPKDFPAFYGTSKFNILFPHPRPSGLQPSASAAMLPRNTNLPLVIQ